MRSWLFVPGDSERKLVRAFEAGADILILDLEDSVAEPRGLVLGEEEGETVASGRHLTPNCKGVVLVRCPTAGKQGGDSKA